VVIPTPLQGPLRYSITSGMVIDTNLWVFSERSSKPARRAGEPKVSFVNGHLAVRSGPRLAARAFVSFSR